MIKNIDNLGICGFIFFGSICMESTTVCAATSCESKNLQSISKLKFNDYQGKKSGF